jgi:hypothetical protein
MIYNTMKFLLFFAPFIKNIDKPICKDCKYYKYNPHYNEPQFAKCTFFSEKNIYNGDITHLDLYSARAMCGLNGTYYIPK